jgi:subtilisin family serine protease
MNLRSLALTLLGILLAGPAFAAPGGDVDLDPALRLLLERSDQELPGVLAAAGSRETPPPIPRAVLAAQPLAETGWVEVLLRTIGPGADLGGDGIQAMPLAEPFVAARVTIPALRRLVENGEISAARLSRPVFPTLDESTRFLGLRQVRRPDLENGTWSGATGRGVVVGIVDSGIDWSHPDFYQPDGLTRIFRYWDQRFPFGTPPQDFPFGQEYRSSAINGGIAGGLDQDGHGTHVVGTAAGGGWGSFVPGEKIPMAGIAPEATLIVVRTIFTEFGVTTGVQYAFERAALLGAPIVMNLSLGNHFGPHRGNTLFEQSLASLVGPGKLIVGAAGNDAVRPIHAEMHMRPGEEQVLEFDVPDYDKVRDNFVFMDIEGWFDPSERYRFTVISPQGNTVGDFVYGNLNREYEDIKGLVRGWYTQDQGLGSLVVEIEDNPASPRRSTGRWKLEVEALEVTKGELDFWVVSWTGNRPEEYPGFATHVDHTETIVSPATSPAIVAVGALSTRTCWTNTSGQARCYPDPRPAYGEIAFFSSLGPTSDGRPKPEVVAPGFGVVSARSSRISSALRPPEELDELGTPDGLYWLTQGTSMSAPHVTGTAALLLEKYPELTFDQLVARLADRGRRVEDPRSGQPANFLHTGETLAPMADLVLSELVPDPAGLRIRWFVGKERGPASYRVYKGFSDEGPFHLVFGHRVIGRNPFEVVDQAVESGRPHVYRITAIDALGLEDDLDTLRTMVPGAPGFVLRAPDPNPARNALSLRFFIPPTAGGGDYRIDVVDVAGRLVREVEAGPFAPGGGERVTPWNLTDNAGRQVAAGVYLVRFGYRLEEGGSKSLVRRVVVLP